MSDVPETVMIDRCAGCAMRPGTEAANAPWTQALFRLCVLAGSPFECHDEGAGHLCKGFVDAFETKAKAGDYDRMPEWRKNLLRNLIEVLQDFREAHERGEVFQMNEALRAAVASAEA